MKTSTNTNINNETTTTTDHAKSYTDFIQSKRIVDIDTGFDVDIDSINPLLFDFQRVIVRWALKRGRAAIFGDTGTGKTFMQLTWADHVTRHTGQPVLIFAPLAVSKQTREEGKKFGVNVHICRKQADIQPGVNIANYEMLHHFEAKGLSGIVLDESSILKGIGAKTRIALTSFAQTIPYRLACTATPSPNDTSELINHAEFLGVMQGKEILAIFFIQDFKATSHKWRLKGHAQKDFWKWLASWARAFRLPSDLGFDDHDFILPAMHMHHHVTDNQLFDNGMLFTLEAKGLQEQREARRSSLVDRVKLCADLINNDTSHDQWLVWCDLNDESAAATKAIDGAVEVKGSDSPEHKESSMIGFANGEIKTLVSKSSICGHGMNFQSCHNVIFLGLSHSFEYFYQAIRRCWRFGQKHEVHVHIITSEAEGSVIANIKRKEQQADQMFKEMLNHMKEFQTVEAKREEMEYVESVADGKGWTLYLGDSVKTVKNIEDESVGLIVYSPPFPGMYSYSNSPHDMGNTKNFDEMLDHYRFLVPDLLRVTKLGRICAVHLTQGIAFKGIDGYVGLKDFRGKVIEIMEDAGWIYYGEVCIEKNPQLKALRTKDQGLLFKTLATDSSKSRMAMADYVLQFRKPGDNPEPIRAGKADHIKGASGGWISNVEWIKWASPVWLMHSEDNPDGIRESDVLNVACARDEQDERHLCPLQLSVIERCVKLWSNPGDIVYSPFAGIGSEGVVSLKFNRQFIGGELKPSYFNMAVKNLREAEKNASQETLF